MSERIIDGLNGVEESECFWYDESGFYVVLTFLQGDFQEDECMKYMVVYSSRTGNTKRLPKRLFPPCRKARRALQRLKHLQT